MYTVETAVPTTPTGVSVTEVDAVSIAVNWDNQTGVNTFKIQHIVKDSGNAFNSTEGFVGGPITAYTLANLDPATMYEIRVIATDDEGDSDPSEVVTGKTCE